MAEKEVKSLTPKQREKIWEAINAYDDKWDRLPQEVIAKDFNGDEDAYLKVMAIFHNVLLD